MTTTPPEPGKDATPEQIEADIAATRERLADNVEALAAKADVKGQAKAKLADTREQVTQAAGQARHQAVDTAKGLPRAAQIGIPVAVLALVVAIVVASGKRNA